MLPKKQLPPPHRSSARRTQHSLTPLEPIPILDTPPDSNPTSRLPPIRRSLPPGATDRRVSRSTTPVPQPPSPAMRRSPMCHPATPNIPRPPLPPHPQGMMLEQIEAIEFHMREERTRIMSDILALAATGTSVNKKPTTPVDLPRAVKEPVHDTTYWIKRWADEAAQRRMKAAATSRALEQASGPMQRTGDDPEMVRMIQELAMEGNKVKSVPRKEGARPMKMKRKAFKKPGPSLVLTESEHSETEPEEEEESTKAV